MNAQTKLPQHFRWRAILIRFLVNAVTIFVVVVLTPQVYFVDPTLLHLLLLALVLGILNAMLKPIIQFFTLPFIFISYGLIIILINSLLIWLLARIFPDALVVDNLFWALVAGALYGIISSFLESLFGLNEPIIPDDSPEDMALRERVNAASVGLTTSFIGHRGTKSQNAVVPAAVIADEQGEIHEGVRDRAPDSVAAIEAAEAIGDVKPQITSAEGKSEFQADEEDEGKS